MREWTEVGFSSIYYLLKKLQRDGLIDARLQEGALGPARKVYHLTPSGSEALRAGVLEALSLPQRPYPPLQLGLANWPVLPRNQALQALRQYRDTLAVRRAQLQASWHRQRPLPPFVDAMFSHGIAMLSAEREWVSDFIRQMEGSQDGL
jgi:DNA-binding PadR family transcriptional regulator